MVISRPAGERARAAGPDRRGLGLGSLVEDHEPTRGQPQAVEVSVELGQPGRNRVRASLAPDLELHRQGHLAEPQAQVHAAETDRVLALDRATAVDDAVQERHQHELRRHLVVRRAPP
jgi:hypothetical protein